MNVKPILLFVISGCAARVMPAAYPDTSPASLAAPPGTMSAVTTATASEPPLPGDPQGDWGPLGPAEEEGAGEADGNGHEHHQHHDHDAQKAGEHEEGHEHDHGAPAEKPADDGHEGHEHHGH